MENLITTIQCNTMILLGASVLLWTISLYLKDASIADIYWGSGFVIVAWASALKNSFQNNASIILLVLMTIWGLRLTLHILLRHIGKKEDKRYAQMRSETPKYFWIISLLKVFILQNFLVLIIALPYENAMSRAFPLNIPLTVVGTLIWLAGFLFEAIGDYQLTVFKKRRTDTSQILDSGLWKYTRHPNYFGDSLMWWGIFVFTLQAPNGFIFVFSPIIITFLLLKVSGVSLLEKTMQEQSDEKSQKYAEYIKKTSAFIPRFPTSS